LPSRPATIVAILCTAEVLSMTPFSMFLALQPALQREWELSNTQSGWISSAYYAGYMLAVPVLSSLTDRVDARAVWLFAAATAAAGALGFAMLAAGTWTAAAAQVVAGAGLAGTYMPGLKVMADRMRPGPRHVAFYTTSFTAGASLSFWIVGRLAAHVRWETAVLAAAAGPILGSLMVATLGRVPVALASRVPTATHWRAVFASSDTIRYVVGYAAHTWELFALRAWLVPFVAFVAVGRPPAATVRATTLAAAVGLIGIPASILGAELTGRIGRRRVVVATMLAAIACSLLVVPAAVAGWPLLVAMLFVYSCFVSADSAALTSGILAVAPAASRGTAMAVYSTLGFAAASAGTFAVGVLLDVLGGQSTVGWAFAFALMGAANVAGAIAIARGRDVNAA
jgi:MFS family permease